MLQNHIRIMLEMLGNNNAMTVVNAFMHFLMGAWFVTLQQRLRLRLRMGMRVV